MVTGGAAFKGMVTVGNKLQVFNPTGGNGSIAMVDISTYQSASGTPTNRIYALDTGSFSASLNFQCKQPGSETNLLVNHMSISATGIISTFNATESTSSTNGAFLMSGGLGVAKNINVGGKLTASNFQSGVISGTSSNGQTLTKTVDDNIWSRTGGRLVTCALQLEVTTVSGSQTAPLTFTLPYPALYTHTQDNALTVLNGTTTTNLRLTFTAGQLSIWKHHATYQKSKVKMRRL